MPDWEQPPGRLRSMVVAKVSTDPSSEVFPAFGAASHLFEDPTVVHLALNTVSLWQIIDTTNTYAVNIRKTS